MCLCGSYLDCDVNRYASFIPRRKYRIPSELRSQAALGWISTVLRDHTGIPSDEVFCILWELGLLCQAVPCLCLARPRPPGGSLLFVLLPLHGVCCCAGLGYLWRPCTAAAGFLQAAPRLGGRPCPWGSARSNSPALVWPPPARVFLFWALDCLHLFLGVAQGANVRVRVHAWRRRQRGKASCPSMLSYMPPPSRRCV